LMAVVFLTVLLSFRGLYSRVPFLLSLALGAIMAYLTIVGIQILTRPNVSLATLRVKALGKLTGSGGAFVAFYAVLALFVAHSAFVRYHEYHGLRGARALAGMTDREQAASLASRTLEQLATADRWGLISNERVERGMLTAAVTLGQHDDAVKFARRVLARRPGDIWARLKLGQALLQLNRQEEAQSELRMVVASTEDVPANMYPTIAAAHRALGGLSGRSGDFATAADHFARAIELDPTQADLHAELGGALAELGQVDRAITSLEQAIRLDPTLSRVHYNLGTLLAFQGRWAEAVDSYRHAVEGLNDDAEVHNNLGYALVQLGDTDAARIHFNKAIAADPKNADAHFNLGRLLAAESRVEEASGHFAQAAALDPRYAQLLQAPE